MKLYPRGVVLLLLAAGCGAGTAAGKDGTFIPAKKATATKLATPAPREQQAVTNAVPNTVKTAPAVNTSTKSSVAGEVVLRGLDVSGATKPQTIGARATGRQSTSPITGQRESVAMLVGAGAVGGSIVAVTRAQRTSDRVVSAENQWTQPRPERDQSSTESFAEAVGSDSDPDFAPSSGLTGSTDEREAPRSFAAPAVETQAGDHVEAAANGVDTKLDVTAVAPLAEITTPAAQRVFEAVFVLCCIGAALYLIQGGLHGR